MSRGLNFVLTIDQAPAITSADSAAILVGNAGAFMVITTGFPGATVTESGDLPSGLSFDSATGILSGTPDAGTKGTYNITFTAQNGVDPDVTQNFTLVVSGLLAFRTDNASTFTVGSSGSFQLTASGGPTPTLSESGNLPDGVTFDPGSGILSGTPSDGTDGSYPIIFTATNSLDTVSQDFTLTVNLPTTTVLTSSLLSSTLDTSITLTATVSGSSVIPTGTVIVMDGSVELNTMTLDANGVASFAISDLPDGDQSLTAVYQGDANYAASTSTAIDQVVNEAPSFLGDAFTTFAVGAAGTYQIVTNGRPAPALSMIGSLPSGVTFTDNGDGTATIAGTPAAGSAGEYSLSIGADNGIGSGAQESFMLHVVELPAITSSAATTFTYDDSNSFTVTATGTPTPFLSMTGNVPSGLDFVDNGDGTATLSGLPDPSAAGIYPVSITASNSAGDVSQDFTLTVASIVTNAGDQSNQEGDTVSVPMAPNAGGATLSFSASGLPSGLSIDSQTVVIAGTIAIGAAAVGPYDCTVSAWDGTYFHNQSFVWNVASPIQIADPGTQSAKEGDNISLPVPVTDATGATPVITMTGLPTGLHYDATSHVISGTIAVGAAGDGPFITTIAADDGTYSTSLNVDWDVTSPVTITNPGDQSSTEGDIVSLAVTVADSSGGTPTVSVDGLPDGLSYHADTHHITGTIGAGAAVDGPFFTTITATDGTYSDSQTFNWNVASPVAITLPGNQTNTESDTISLPVTVSDSTGASATVTVSGLPTGLSYNAGTHLITGTISIGAAAEGPFTTTINATDGTYSDTETINWDVASPITIDGPGDQTNLEGDMISLAVSATSAGSSTPSISISGLPDGLSFDDSTGLITGTIDPGASANGPFTTTITATDGMYSASQSFTWNVTSPVAIDNPGDQSSVEGDTIALSIVATDATYGAMTIAVSGLPADLSYNAYDGTISGTINAGAAANDPYIATISASDGTYSASVTLH